MTPKTLTNHHTAVESRCVTTLSGTATDEPHQRHHRYRELLQVTGTLTIVRTFGQISSKFPAPQTEGAMASAYYEFYRGSSYVLLVHLSRVVAEEGVAI